MRPSLTMRPWGLENVALLTMFSAVVLAQGNGNGNGNGNNNNDNNNTTPTTQNNNRPTTTPTAGNGNTNGGNNNNRPTTTPTQRDQTTRTTESKTTPTAALPTISDTNMPTLETTGAPMPTIPGAFTRPVPAVPPTVDAPFMHRSTMPDGTVFIAVGAILGAFGVAVLVWRAIVACLLHRSVERAAAAQHLANEKSTYLAPPAAFYKNNDREPSPPGGSRNRRTTRGPIPSSTPSQSNLFFSPTAAGSAAMGGNRDSRYLPSGFYAAGTSPSPAMGGAPSSLGYSNLRPDSRGGYSRNTMREHSPEGSPQFAVRQDPSMSSLNLNRPPSQRAPSAYLDDLLDENPQMFPPAQMPPQAAHGSRHNQNFSHSSQGRY